MLDTIRKRFGLLGRNISYSFSKGYFTEKFNKDKLFDGCTYENFDIPEITAFPEIIKNTPDLKGMNVTIPYKEVVIPYLDKLSKKATEIGAVNTIKFTKKGKLKGYNTDYYGFMKSLEPLLQPHHKKALILGTGGASKGVAYALKELGILYTFVSREAKEGSPRLRPNQCHHFRQLPNHHQFLAGGNQPQHRCFSIDSLRIFHGQTHCLRPDLQSCRNPIPEKSGSQRAHKPKTARTWLVFQAEKAWEIWNK